MNTLEKFQLLDDTYDLMDKMMTGWHLPTGFQIGEYSFPEEWEDFDYEWFTDDVRYKARVLCDVIEVNEIVPIQLSSKSGVVVVLETENPIDPYYTGQGFETNEEALAFLRQNNAFDEFEEHFTEARQALKDVMEVPGKLDAYIKDKYATGFRSGIFSNGEVVFTPTRRSNYAERFTPYYNPNE